MSKSSPKHGLGLMKSYRKHFKDDSWFLPRLFVFIFLNPIFVLIGPSIYTYDAVYELGRWNFGQIYFSYFIASQTSLFLTLVGEAILDFHLRPLIKMRVPSRRIREVSSFFILLVIIVCLSYLGVEIRDYFRDFFKHYERLKSYVDQGLKDHEMLGLAWSKPIYADNLIFLNNIG